MKWVTRANAKVDRVACPWLIKRYVDPDAQFLFVPPDQVLATAKRDGARSFDADGAEFGHEGSNCTFETMMERFNLDDPVLRRLAATVHGADIPEEIDMTPESAGLRAVAEGLAAVEKDDHRKLEVLFPVYDALYAYFAAADRKPPEEG